MRRAGFQLVELVVAMAIGVIVTAFVTPSAIRLTAGLRVALAAAEVTTALQAAKAHAVLQGESAAVKFRHGADGSTSFTVYRDGDGDGVLNRDIESGVDSQVGPARQLRHLGPHVRFGFPSGPPPRDPSDPRRYLDRLEDPLRFNRSDLASFSPLGGSTPGSVYLTDGHYHLSTVRLLGITGKVKTMKYVRLTETWE